MLSCDTNKFSYVLMVPKATSSCYFCLQKAQQKEWILFFRTGTFLSIEKKDALGIQTGLQGCCSTTPISAAAISRTDPSISFLPISSFLPFSAYPAYFPCALFQSLPDPAISPYPCYKPYPWKNPTLHLL